MDAMYVVVFRYSLMRGRGGGGPRYTMLLRIRCWKISQFRCPSIYSICSMSTQIHRYPRRSIGIRDDAQKQTPDS